MKVVATYSIPLEAQIVVARLQSAGISAVIRDQNTVELDWMLSNAIGGVRIEVPDDEYSDAVEIVREAAIQEGLIRCPKCSSNDIYVRPIGVFAAVCISLRLPIPVKTYTIDCRCCHNTFEVSAK